MGRSQSPQDSIKATALTLSRSKRKVKADAECCRSCCRICTRGQATELRLTQFYEPRETLWPNERFVFGLRSRGRYRVSFGCPTCDRECQEVSVERRTSFGESNVPRRRTGIFRS